MPTDRPLPRFASLTQDSSREEVLAAVAESDRRAAEVDAAFAAAEFPEVPEGYRGCVWSKCGRFKAFYGRTEESPTLAAQRVAGEEDQSQPGWDGA